MNLKSATKALKEVNPKNISGTIPQALEMVKELQEKAKKGNPKMVESVGIQNLVGALKFIKDKFHPPSKKKDEQEEEIVARVEELINSLQLEIDGTQNT